MNLLDLIQKALSIILNVMVTELRDDKDDIDKK